MKLSRGWPTQSRAVQEMGKAGLFKGLAVVGLGTGRRNAYSKANLSQVCIAVAVYTAAYSVRSL